MRKISVSYYGVRSGTIGISFIFNFCHLDSFVLGRYSVATTYVPILKRFQHPLEFKPQYKFVK